jgi:hypothetical protein
MFRPVVQNDQDIQSGICGISAYSNDQVANVKNAIPRLGDLYCALSSPSVRCGYAKVARFNAIGEGGFIMRRRA